MNAPRSLMNKVTPECHNMAKRVVTLNAISVFFALVGVILLIVALVYIYMPATEAADITRNKNVAGITNIFALLSVVVSLLIGIWQILVAGKIKECIDPNSSKSN